ncbi:MAG: hypothetical protein NVSMB34_03200 [Variovorax sp.]
MRAGYRVPAKPEVCEERPQRFGFYLLAPADPPRPKLPLAFVIPTRAWHLLWTILWMFYVRTWRPASRFAATRTAPVRLNTLFQYVQPSGIGG